MSTLQATADFETICQRVKHLIDAGRVGAARPLLAAARRMAAPSPDLAQLAARIALSEGDLDGAGLELDTAIAATPDHAGLRLSRADLRWRQGNLDGATRDAAEAVVLDASLPSAKAMLGSLMLELQRPVDAVACLAEAVRAVPREPSYREALATAYEAGGDADRALATLTEGFAVTPGNVGLRNAAILLCVRRRDFTEAVSLAEQARGLGVTDACLFGLKGHALSSLGRHEEAADSYREALKLGPDDPYVRHLVAATGLVSGAKRAPDAYLKTVFDGYADRFEGHLISLGYRIPGVVRQILQEHPAVVAGESIGPVLDLGCGTGLMALAISDLPIGPVTGVDISPRMLAQAQAKQLYAELHDASLMDFLQADSTRWPLILAGDVVCYFGALEELFAVIYARLQPGGWFVFSAEAVLPDRSGVLPGNGDWALQRQGRYAHAAAYVQASAIQSGFRINQLSSEAIRQEAGVPVAGMVAVLERRHHDA